MSSFLDTAKRIQSRCKSRFVYTPDTEAFGKFEHWQSFHGPVMNDEQWHGDCDDFAITAATLASLGDIPHDRIGLCTGWISAKRMENYHAVGLFLDDNGIEWLWDCNAIHMYRLNAGPYVFIPDKYHMLPWAWGDWREWRATTE